MNLPRYIFFLLSVLLIACQDNCDYYRSYKKFDPIYSTMETLRDSVLYDSIREINNPGKLNYKGGYLFISETGKGIHIVDNRNINSPINIGFIKLPGNYDLATKGDFLYADSYIDLVIFDISNIHSISESNRLKGTFEQYYIDQNLYDKSTDKIVIGYDEKIIEENIKNYNCDYAFD